MTKVTSTRWLTRLSRKLTVAELNYPAHVLELLAVVYVLRVFKHYLLGSHELGAGAFR